jgi:hypothetical protein
VCGSGGVVRDRAAMASNQCNWKPFLHARLVSGSGNTRIFVFVIEVDSLVQVSKSSSLGYRTRITPTTACCTFMCVVDRELKALH